MIAPGTCGATKIEGLSLTTLGAPVRDMAAAAVPGGYVLAFVLEPEGSLFGVPISDALVPAYPAPIKTSPRSGTGVYTSVSMHYDGTNLLATLGPNDTNTWFKTLHLGIADFIYAEQLPDTIGTPVETANTLQGVTWWFDTSGVLWTTLLAADGSISGEIMRGSITLPDDVAGASGDYAVLATQVGTACEIRHLGGGPYAETAIASQCRAPQLLGGHGDTYWITYERGSDVVARSLRIAGVAVSVAAEQVLGAGRMPQVLDTTPPTVLYRTSSGWAATVVDNGETHVVLNAPATDGDDVEAVGPYAFAVFGDEVYAMTCN